MVNYKSSGFENVNNIQRINNTMNYFEMLDRSRKSALYAYLRMQRNNLNTTTTAVAGGSESKPEPEPEPSPEPTPDPEPDPFVDYTDVESPEELRSMLEDPDVPEVKVTVSESMNVTGEQPLVVESGKTLKLNLENGAEITASGATDPNTKDAVIVVKNGAELVIDGDGAVVGDNTQYAGIKLTAKEPVTESGVTAKDGGVAKAKLTINGGTVRGKYYAISGNGARSGTEVVINGGTLEGFEPNDSTAIFNPQGDSSVTINGGTLKGAMCVYLKSGKLTVNGGTFVANGERADYRTSRNGFNNTGDCIVVDNCGYPGEVPSASVVGGTFTSENNHAFASYNTDGYDRVVNFVDGSKVDVTEAVTSDADVYVD